MRHFGEGVSSASYVAVAKRIKENEGLRLVSEGDFSNEQAAHITDLVDKLLEAKASGEIPDLHEYDLSRVYVSSEGKEQL